MKLVRRYEMYRGRFLAVALTALVIIGLLAIGGAALHRAGYSQGYAMGIQATGREGGPVVFYGWGFLPLLCGTGLFFLAGLFLLRLLVFGVFFRTWKMAGGPHYGHWGKHGHRRHGRMPPWYADRQQPSEEPVEKAEPDAESGATERES
jgi:hypothetical protein